MTAAARGTNESFDAFIENLMHEGEDTQTQTGEDTDMLDDTAADGHNSVTADKACIQRDAEGRRLHEQTINTESWDPMFADYCKISKRTETGRIVKPPTPPQGVKNFQSFHPAKCQKKHT